MQNIIVVNNPDRWQLSEQAPVISAREYLTSTHYSQDRSLRVFNLCSSYRYQTLGYYVSLLAEARGQRVIPEISTIQDFKSKTIIRSISDELDTLFQKSLRRIKSENFTLSVYFGKNFASTYDELSKELYNLFQTPLFKAQFVYNKRWVLENISPLQVTDIPEEDRAFVTKCADEYFNKKRHALPMLENPIFDLAILVDPEEKAPPSNKQALKNFITAAEEEHIHVETITENEYSRIEEFDALFIRATTSVNHYTYRFARRALTEGIAVIDDPDSIMRCSNKVYLAELLAKAKIPTPPTMIVHKYNTDQVEATVQLPCVLKLPDSSFSQGVIKVSTAEELQTKLHEMLQESDLLIAQSFMPTAFDWRIGILDNKPLFACKYFMAKNHWQIYDWENKTTVDGKHETLPIDAVPKKVVRTALEATQLIGDGLYGVDLKEVDGEVLVIEVNDNPNIDNRVEDQVSKQKLYETIIYSFMRRVEKLRKQEKVAL